MFLGAGAFFFSVFLASAYNPQPHDTPRPYDEQVIDGDYRYQSYYLGELKGDPHMYEFSTGHEDQLQVKLFQKPTDKNLPLSLIVVRLNEERGVTEVGRLRGSEVVWGDYEDSALGVDLKSSNEFTADLKAGIYRIEVSTPENVGKYLLVVGKEAREYGYFETLGGVREIQNFFGYSFLAIFTSSLVSYPLVIVLLIVLSYFTWRHRQKFFKHA